MMKSDMWAGALFKSKHGLIKSTENLTTGLIISYQEIILLVTSLLNVYMRVETEDMENKVRLLRIIENSSPFLILLNIC